jgi:HlyD family secretion protein
MAKALAKITPTQVSKTDAEAQTTRALLEFQSPTLALISQPMPRFSFYGTYIIASMVVALLLIAGLFPIDRVVTAIGKVTTKDSNLLVQPLDISIVRSINVQVGQHVQAGQLLARLDPTLTAADEASLKAQTKSLTAQVQRLNDELMGRPYISDGSKDGQLQEAIFGQHQAELAFKEEDYKQKISSLEVALRKAEAEVPIYAEREGYAQTLLNSRKKLEQQGVGSRLNTLQAQDSLAEARRLAAGARSAAAGAQKDLDAMIAERDGFIREYRNTVTQTLSETGRQLADAREQLAKAQKHANLVEMRADRDATVLAIANVSVGSVLQVGDPFITLVPDDAVMQVDGAIPASEVAFVRVGDPVVIKFDAYQMTQHGYAEGTVIAMAPDSQDNPAAGQSMSQAMAPQKPGISPIDLGESVYHVKISIDSLNKMTNLPPDFRLQPGLGVQADVKVGKRTALSYLFARFIPALTEGMREP